MLHLADSQLPITEPPGGWEAFVTATWERRHAHFRNCFPTPLISEQEFFDVLYATCKDCSAPSQRQRVRFYLEHTRLVARSLADYMPRIEDESLDGYKSRMTALLNGMDFSIIVGNAQAHDFELWNRMRHFLSGLYNYIGMPLRSEAMLYASVARSTPIGLHVDPYSNFLFQVSGRKRFRMWPSSIVRANPEVEGTANYTKILDDAITIDMNPGDILYIPSDYYHISEAGDELSAHLSFLISTAAEVGSLIAKSMIAEIVGRRVHSSMFVPFVTQPLSNSVDSSLPPGWSAAIEACSDLGLELRKSMIAEVLRLRTSFGCEVSPPLAESSKLFDSDLVERDPQSNFEHYVFHETVYYSANGYGFSCPAHSQIMSLFEKITDGQRHKVSDLMSTYCGSDSRHPDMEMTADAIRRVLQMFHRIRVIRKAVA